MKNLSVFRVAVLFMSLNRTEVKSTNSDLQYLNVIPENPENCTEGMTQEKDYTGIEPPVFLKKMYERIISEDKGFARDVIGRALHPVSLTYGNLETGVDSETSVLVYKISREQIANFHSAKIVFTLLNNSTDQFLHAGSHMWVKANLFRRSEKQSQSLEHRKQFYKHDFTNFFKQNLNWTDPKSQTSLLKLEVVVFKNNRRKEVSLKQVFDVGKDQPFLLLQYVRDEDDSKNDANLDQDSLNEIVHFETRPKRSPELNAAYSKLCRRQEWSVKPVEVGLKNIAAPKLLDLGFCAGTCQIPLIESQNSTYYATFVNQYRALRNSDSTCKLPNTICVPMSYKSQIVLQAEDSGFTIINYDNGAVDSCGCA